jgi:hypothetical protein
MKQSWLACAAVTAAILTTPVWADEKMSSDSMSSSSMSDSHKKMMKDCMDKQKAQNANMSMDDMKKACKSEMKMKGDHPMGADTPNPTTPTTKGNPAPQTGSQTNPPQ